MLLSCIMFIINYDAELLQIVTAWFIINYDAELLQIVTTFYYNIRQIDYRLIARGITN